MKIVVIGTAHPFRGGLASFNERLAIELMKEGHEVVLNTFTVQYPNFLFPGKSQYSSSPKPNINIQRSINSINPLNWIRVGFQLRQACPDLIIIKYWLPFMGPCFGTILRLAKKNKKTKVLCIIDNIIPHEKRVGDHAFTKYFVKPVDAFITMSQGVMDDLQKFDNVKPRVLTPHPLFDNFGEIGSRAAAVKALGLEEEYQYILFFGFIREYKGLDLLLRALGELDLQSLNVKLIVAGEFYDDKVRYENIIDDLNLREFILLKDDFIPNEEVANYFNAAELVVQPYKTATQSGVTQIAYHFEKPMVVTNVGGLPEMCPHEKVGYVVPPDATELAKAIKRFFKEGKKEEMVTYVRSEKKKYSWSILGKNIFTLAEQIFVSKKNDISQ